MPFNSNEDNTPLASEVFESSFVHEFYSLHSNEFNKSRINSWSFIPSFFNKYYKNNMLILDSGCGNGRNIIKNNIIAMDISKELLKNCKKIKELKIKGDKELNTVYPLDIIACDGLYTYFKDCTFNIILSISVIHHLSTEERRIKYLNECKRLLKDNGYILIYVWDIRIKYKSKFKHINEYKEILQLNGNEKLEFNDNDFIAIWNKKDEMKRYYHLFTMDEIKDLCCKVGLRVLEKGNDKESIYLVLTK